MSDQELELKLRTLSGDERRITLEILRLINIAEKSGLPQRRGHPSTLDWLVREYAYSESAAHRRVNAARLLRELPTVESQLLAGTHNLSNLSKAQSMIRKQERVTNKKLSKETKLQILSQIENQTGHQAERTLFAMLPEAAGELQMDSLKRIDANTFRLSLTLDEQTVEALKYCKNLLSNANPTATWSEVITHLAHVFIAGKKIGAPAGGKNSGAVKHRVASSARARISTKVRKTVWERGNRRCQYIDEKTGRRCETQYRLEVDHIIPVALGGSNNPENLRLLCRAHNQYYADVVFGREFMDRKRKEAT